MRLSLSDVYELRSIGVRIKSVTVIDYNYKYLN